MLKLPQSLKEMEKQFFELYQIPLVYMEYTCGAESDDEDCPSEDTECKDCPYKTLEARENTITGEQWVELINTCGNQKLLRFPYKSSTIMKKHVLQVVTNSYKFPPIVKVVNKLFLNREIEEPPKKCYPSVIDNSKQEVQNVRRQSHEIRKY